MSTHMNGSSGTASGSSTSSPFVPQRVTPATTSSSLQPLARSPGRTNVAAALRSQVMSFDSPRGRGKFSFFDDSEEGADGEVDDGTMSIPEDETAQRPSGSSPVHHPPSPPRSVQSQPCSVPQSPIEASRSVGGSPPSSPRAVAIPPARSPSLSSSSSGSPSSRRKRAQLKQLHIPSASSAEATVSAQTSVTTEGPLSTTSLSHPAPLLKTPRYRNLNPILPAMPGSDGSTDTNSGGGGGGGGSPGRQPNRRNLLAGFGKGGGLKTAPAKSPPAVPFPLLKTPRYRNLHSLPSVGGPSPPTSPSSAPSRSPKASSLAASLSQSDGSSTTTTTGTVYSPVKVQRTTPGGSGARSSPLSRPSPLLRTPKSRNLHCTFSFDHVKLDDDPTTASTTSTPPPGAGLTTTTVASGLAIAPAPPAVTSTGNIARSILKTSRSRPSSTATSPVDTTPDSSGGHWAHNVRPSKADESRQPQPPSTRHRHMLRKGNSSRAVIQHTDSSSSLLAVDDVDGGLAHRRASAIVTPSMPGPIKRSTTLPTSHSEDPTASDSRGGSLSPVPPGVRETRAYSPLVAKRRIRHHSGATSPPSVSDAPVRLVTHLPPTAAATAESSTGDEDEARVRTFLSGLKLAQYANALVEAGYDCMARLTLLDAESLKELESESDGTKFKLAHKKQLLAAVAVAGTSGVSS